jgi:preprotein translocase subunit SecB
MSDTPDESAAPTQDLERPPATLRVLTQFIKDLSFENPGALTSSQNQETPEIELAIDVRVEPGSQKEPIFGVDLRLSAKAKRQDAVVFIIDLTYTGVFQLQSLDASDVEPVLLIECPRLLFPFARRIVAEVSRDGGHPPLMIDPIDFLGLYRNQRNDQSSNGAGSDTPQAPN